MDPLPNWDQFLKDPESLDPETYKKYVEALRDEERMNKLIDKDLKQAKARLKEEVVLLMLGMLLSYGEVDLICNRNW